MRGARDEELKNGTTAKYIYYGCNRSIDKNCKGPYVREDDLIRQLCKLIDNIGYNDLAVQVKFEDELKRFNRFQRGVLQFSDGKIKQKEIDLKTHIKYVLHEGSNQEKRELMGCFKSRIKVVDGVVAIE
jgi:hypothetical protein